MQLSWGFLQLLRTQWSWTMLYEVVACRWLLGSALSLSSHWCIKRDKLVSSDSREFPNLPSDPMLKTCLEEGELCHVNGLSDFLKVLCL